MEEEVLKHINLNGVSYRIGCDSGDVDYSETKEYPETSIGGALKSSQDLIATMKEKLNTLSNYDDTEIRGLIKGVSEALDRLIGTEDTTQVIDTFNEVIAFLNSFKNYDNLAYVLQELERNIQDWVVQKGYATQTQIEDLTAKIKGIEDTLYGDFVEATIPTTGSTTSQQFEIAAPFIDAENLTNSLKGSILTLATPDGQQQTSAVYDESANGWISWSVWNGGLEVSHASGEHSIIVNGVEDVAHAPFIFVSLKKQTTQGLEDKIKEEVNNALTDKVDKEELPKIYGTIGGGIHKEVSLDGSDMVVQSLSLAPNCSVEVTVENSENIIGGMMVYCGEERVAEAFIRDGKLTYTNVSSEAKEYTIVFGGAPGQHFPIFISWGMLKDKVDKVPGKDLSSNDFTDDNVEQLLRGNDVVVLEAEPMNIPPMGIVANIPDAVGAHAKYAIFDKKVYKVFNSVGANGYVVSHIATLTDIDNTLTLEGYAAGSKAVGDKFSQLDSKMGELDGKKVNKEEGKGLSTNDYTNAEKSKLEGLENYDDTKLREEVEGKQDKLTEEQMENVNADHAKFAEKTELNKVEENVNDLNELNYVYGVVIDETLSSPNLQRVGNLELHKSLPVQSLMRRCLLLDDGTVNYYLDANNSLLKEDGTEANLDGTDGMVMVEMPRHYRRLKMLSESSYRVDISLYPFNGAIEIPQMYVSAWEATVDRSNGNMLSSVVNTDVRYRGGNNQSAWDGTYRSVLGKPATAISLTNYRNYARKRGEGWNCYEYRAHLVLFWMYTIEYATLHSQKAYNAELTEEGYKQGGMGDGVTNINSTKWNTYNSYYPIIPCGYTASLGNNTGVVPFSFNEEQQEAYGGTYTDSVPSYRGIENPFGHIFKWTDGVMFDIHADSDSGESFACKVADANDYGNTSKQIPFGLIPRANGYVKNVILTEDGDIIPRSTGAGTTTYFCDYFYTSLPASGNSWRGLLLGGSAYYGAFAGLAYSSSNNAASHTAAHICSRLCFCRTSKL